MTNLVFRFERIHCPLCESLDFTVLGKKSGGYYAAPSPSGDAARVVRCRRCRFIYANEMPFPARDDLVDLYNEEYTKLLSEFVPYQEQPRDFVDIVEAHRRLQRLESILGRRGGLLDIGCGPANLLCVARERGWRVTGLEINEASARFARTVNRVDVVEGRIQDHASRWAGRFDAVHFNQVLEHTYDPIGFLKSVRRVVRSGGVFFCGVPNEDSIMNNLAQLYFSLRGAEFTPMLAPTFPPYHVLGFSPRTIRLMLEKTGFRVLRVEHINYHRLDAHAFRRGQILRGLKSVVGMLARLFRHGHGLDVYGVPA